MSPCLHYCNMSPCLYCCNMSPCLHPLLQHESVPAPLQRVCSAQGCNSVIANFSTTARRVIFLAWALSAPIPSALLLIFLLRFQYYYQYPCAPNGVIVNYTHYKPTPPSELHRPWVNITVKNVLCTHYSLSAHPFCNSVIAVCITLVVHCSWNWR